MKKTIYVVLFTMILLMGLTTISHAAFSVQSKTVKSGENFSISLSSGSAMDSYTVKLLSHEGITFNSCSKSKSTDSEVIQVSGGSIGYMNTDGTTTSLGTYSFTAPTVSEDKTYKISFNVDNEATVTSTIIVKAPVATATPAPTAAPTAEPTAKPTANPTSAPQVEPEKTETVTPAPENEKPVVTPEPTKSSNADLSNLGIRPNDFSGFTPERTSYNVSVPYEVESVEVYAVKDDDEQTVEGTGTKSLSEGSNVCEITVTAEDGAQKTYRITIVRLAKEETNNPEVDNPDIKVEVALASLQIVSVTLNEPFKPDVYNYTATANADAKEIIVSGSANTENAVVDIEAPEEYEIGENIIKITVREKEGENKKVYTVKVTKEAAEKEDGKVDNQNVVKTIGKIDNNNKNSGGGIPTSALLFCGGIAFITVLGIIFAVIRYRKDKNYEEMEDDEYEDDEIGSISDISAKEAIIDAAVATGKLTNANLELDPEPETDFDPDDGPSTPRRRGKHF